jgi:hypothetical protein
LFDPGFLSNNLESVDLHLKILYLLADAGESNPLFIDILSRDVLMPAVALHALELLSILDPDTAFKRLQLLSKTSSSEIVSPSFEISVRGVLERLGPHRAYRFIDEAKSPPSPLERSILEMLPTIYLFAFEESGLKDNCYMSRCDGADGHEVIPTSPEFVKRVVEYGMGSTTFDEVRLEVEVLTE